VSRLSTGVDGAIKPVPSSFFGLNTKGPPTNVGEAFVRYLFGICPWGRNVEPIWFEFFFAENELQTEATLLFSGSETSIVDQV
jgi:hypothetical protein